MQFNSIFYRKNKMILATLLVYSILIVLFSVVLAIGTVNKYYIQSIGLTVFLVFMALRAAYFIFEKIQIDSNKKVVTYKILKKSIPVGQITSIKKIRPGQLRLVLEDNKQLPVSVDNEDVFIETLQQMKPSITV